MDRRIAAMQTKIGGLKLLEPLMRFRYTRVRVQGLYPSYYYCTPVVCCTTVQDRAQDAVARAAAIYKQTLTVVCTSASESIRRAERSGI